VMGQIFAVIGLAATMSHVAPHIFVDDRRRQRGLGDDDEHCGQRRSIPRGVGTPVSEIVIDYLKCCCGARVW
jgi:hypothetical protein